MLSMAFIVIAITFNISDNLHSKDDHANLSFIKKIHLI